MTIVNAVVLWIHLVTAMFFVGGSLFVWWVVVPASYRLTRDEKKRMEIVGTIVGLFGRIIGPTILILIASGIYCATWYLPSFGALFTTPAGLVLLAKILLTGVLFGLLGIHDIYYSRKIRRLVADGKAEELARVRRSSRVVSLAMMVAIGGILALVIVLGILG